VRVSTAANPADTANTAGANPCDKAAPCSKAPCNNQQVVQHRGGCVTGYSEVTEVTKAPCPSDTACPAARSKQPVVIRRAQTRPYQPVAAKVVVPKPLPEEDTWAAVSAVRKAKLVDSSQVEKSVRAFIAARRSKPAPLTSLDHLKHAVAHLAAAGLHEEAAMVRERARRETSRINQRLIEQKTAQLERLQKEVDALKQQMLPRQVSVQSMIAEIPAAAFASVKKQLEQHMLQRGFIIGDAHYTILKHQSFAAAIKQLQAVKQLMVVSRPQLITQEGQPAECHVGQTSPWIPVRSNPDSGVIRQVALEEFGLSLEVKPVVSGSGKIELHSNLVVTGYDETAPTGRHIHEILRQQIEPVVADGETVAYLVAPGSSARRNYAPRNSSSKGYLITLKPSLLPAKN